MFTWATALKVSLEASVTLCYHHLTKEKPAQSYVKPESKLGSTDFLRNIDSTEQIYEFYKTL